MKLILSRKGFDSGSGGGPSPVMPDGRMVSLPIPDRTAPKAYADLSWAPGQSMGDIIRDLAPARVRPDHFAHLDPDLDPGTVQRQKGWRPIFGQTGSSQTHLANSGVGAGDVFLFFGLFRKAQYRNERLSFVGGAKPAHVLFGWLQVDSVRGLDPVSWTLSERRIRCPHRWQRRPRGDERVAGSMTTSKRRLSGWCSTKARASARSRATSI